VPNYYDAEDAWGLHVRLVCPIWCTYCGKLFYAENSKRTVSTSFEFWEKTFSCTSDSCYRDATGWTTD